MSVRRPAPSRRTRITGLGVALIAALAAVVVALMLHGGASARTQQQPNIIVVMTDDQTVDTLRAMPQLDALLAEQGVTFSNSYVSNPVCCPSRASYLTGQYSHNNGVLRNSGFSGGFGALDGAETLPVWLGRAGYRTAHIGKYLNEYGLAGDPTAVPPGWDEWYASIDGSTYRMYGYTLNENGKLVTYGRFGEENPYAYQTDVYTAKAADFIRRSAPSEQPFFLSIAPLAPHVETKQRVIGGDDDPPIPNFPNPRPALRHAGAFDDLSQPRPSSFDERDVSDKPAAIAALPPLTRAGIEAERKRYTSRLASLLAVDDMIAALVATLDSVGELDQTIIVFTSDNGFLLGEHRIQAAKGYPYEESVRVPLIVRGPGIPAGETRTQPAVNVDLAPTILDYAGAEPGLTEDGSSLRAPIEDPTLPAGRAVLLENWCQEAEACYSPDPAAPRYRAVRSQRYLYAEYATGERELYDLRTDPDELHNIAGDPAHAEVEAALAALLVRLAGCAGSDCRAVLRVP